MIDSLLTRAQLAILESNSLRGECRRLKEELEGKRVDLRRSVFESEMQRIEITATRQNRE